MRLLHGDHRRPRRPLVPSLRRAGRTAPTSAPSESVAGPDGELHPIQQAFRECHGLQCGYCTPGFVMAILNYLETEPEPDLSEQAVREVLSGNLCRCTGYKNIVAAFRRSVELMHSRP